jgi:hypothetical protein
MKKHTREKKVLIILGISITLGTLILSALGHNPPSAGAFCLSRYYLLGPVEKSIVSRAEQLGQRWNEIEVFYSGTESGNAENLAGSGELDSSARLDYHFVVCNGKGGHDGLIQTTEKWQNQTSVVSGQRQDDGQDFYRRPTDRTIYICVVADDETSYPTNFQITRTEELVGELCRRFKIRPESIRYPDSWQ